MAVRTTDFLLNELARQQENMHVTKVEDPKERVPPAFKTSFVLTKYFSVVSHHIKKISQTRLVISMPLANVTSSYLDILSNLIKTVTTRTQQNMYTSAVFNIVTISDKEPRERIRPNHKIFRTVTPKTRTEDIAMGLYDAVGTAALNIPSVPMAHFTIIISKRIELMSREFIIEMGELLKYTFLHSTDLVVKVNFGSTPEKFLTSKTHTHEISIRIPQALVGPEEEPIVRQHLRRLSLPFAAPPTVPNPRRGTFSGGASSAGMAPVAQPSPIISARSLGKPPRVPTTSVYGGKVLSPVKETRAEDTDGDSKTPGGRTRYRSKSVSKRARSRSVPKRRRSRSVPKRRRSRSASRRSKRVR